MTRCDVVSIGSAVQDIFIRPDAARIIDFPEAESGQALCLPLGAKLDVSLMQHEVGGGAANTSVAFRRMGLRAAVLSRVGHDFAGRMIREALSEEGVVVDHLVRDDDDPTGQSVLVIAPDGNRTVLVSRGASKDFRIEDIDEGLVRQAQWLYVSSIGGNLEVLRRIFALCALHHIHLAWNPGRMELDHQQADLAPLLRQTDVLLLNREEAAHLTRLPRSTVEELMTHLIGLVEEGVVVVTNGAEGASAFDGSSISTLPGREVPVVDATGAGDSFGSGFVSARILGATMEQALAFAVANAESVIGHVGAQEGLLRRRDFDCLAPAHLMQHRLSTGGLPSMS